MHTLFADSKSLFLKIINVILLIWLLTAVFFWYSTSIALIMPEPIQTYEEYKGLSCQYFDEEVTEQKREQTCRNRYESYKGDHRRSYYYSKRGLVIAVGNVIIVGTTLVLLNKKKED